MRLLSAHAMQLGHRPWSYQERLGAELKCDVELHQGEKLEVEAACDEVVAHITDETSTVESPKEGLGAELRWWN